MLVMHWTQPYHCSIDPLIYGYRCGMKIGDPENAMYCIYYVMFFSFLCGRSLERLEADCFTYIQKCKDFKQDISVWYINPVLQAIINLRRGPSKTVLTGEAMNINDLMELKGTGDTTVCAGLSMQMVLAAHFGEYEEGAKLALNHGRNAATLLVGCPHSEVIPYVNGICLFVMARRTKKRVYKRAANRCRRKLKHWDSSGNPNCNGYMALLNAEKSALSRNKVEAVKFYKEAIYIAGRRGAIHDQALANQQLAEFQRETGNLSDSKYHYNLAIQLYSQWGAQAKVLQLRRDQQKVLNYECNR